MDSLIQTVKDNNLKLTLSFGIALHHAGLHERDRKIAEELFVNQKIQVNSRFIFLFSYFFLYLTNSNINVDNITKCKVIGSLEVFAGNC